MDQSQNNNLEFKDKFSNFYKMNKKKIYFLLFSIFIFIIIILLMNFTNNRNNTLIAEKYIQAGLYLSTDKKEKSIKLYEDIILSKNKFYSILALNTILEKNLISDNSKILEYFNLLENNISSKDSNDLIILKKALFLIDNSDFSDGKKLLDELINNNSIYKLIAKDILEK